MTTSRALSAALLLAALAPAASAAEPMTLAIDATDLPRKLLHSRITIPVPREASRSGGTLGLWYPKWIPGTHGPGGPVQNVAGLVVSEPSGERLAWTREPGEAHRINVTVPRGVREVVVEVRYITNQSTPNSRGVDSFGSDLIGFVSPNTVLLYPDGAMAATTRVRASLVLPDDWTAACALRELPSETTLGVDADDEPNRVAWEETTLETLVDSPVVVGLHAKAHDLVSEGWRGRVPPHVMTVFSEAESVVDLPEDMVALFRSMVEQAALLFGSHPFEHYDALVATTNVFGRSGLEHLESSWNVLPQRALQSVESLDGWNAYLIPHEYAHAWCGKYRRPAGMVTPDYHSPKDTELLWVYEGLTQYLGALLAVRAGITSPEEHRWSLQETVRSLRLRQGREWRALSDTGAASHLLRAGSASWGHLRRSQDYYSEGALVWLEADAVIRRKSEGRSSLDDFVRTFFRFRPDEPVPLGFDRDEVVATLSALADHDWDGFLRERIEQPSPRLATRVTEELGLLVQFTHELPKGPGDEKYDELDLRDSLGVSFSKEGRVRSVQLGSPADAAGLGPGMKVLGVGEHVWSPDRLTDVVARSASTGVVDLLVVSGERIEQRSIAYEGGPRWMVLVRDEEAPDVLADVLEPLEPPD
jgi:predicted metalloprotease with PDZ domain